MLTRIGASSSTSAWVSLSTAAITPMARTQSILGRNVMAPQVNVLKLDDPGEKYIFVCLPTVMGAKYRTMIMSKIDVKGRKWMWSLPGSGILEASRESISGLGIQS